MKLLVLGGTAFLGRTIARHAASSNIDVTCLARGTQPPDPDVTFIRADRDAPDALEPVTGQIWDAVIDVTSQPAHARRAAQQLTARHWVFISTASVYTQFAAPEQDETAPTCTPLTAETMTDMSQYGPAKMACENAYREAPGSVTIIRPGLIGGFGDWSGRSGYYPWRFAHPTGDDVLLPDPTQPTALIDVEDLAAWSLHCARERTAGIFNATGPTTTLGDIYDHCRSITRSGATPRPIDDATLLHHGVSPWMGPKSLPLWVPDPSLRHLATLDTARARSHGLTTRPLVETLAAALRYEEAREEPRHAGLTDDDERNLRVAVG